MAATTVDSVVVRLDADLGPLRRGLSQSTARIRQSTERMKKSFSSLGASVTQLATRMSTLRGGMIAVGGVAAVMAGKQLADLNAKFQDLELTLQTVFGGMEEGEAAMDFIMEFAQRTPFDIETLSKAFIQLGGAGIKPTEELLTTFGDAAAATTNRVAAFEAMVRIATRAVGGGLGLEELEQLVNQGIPVYAILQEEIGVTRSEISELGQTAEGAAKIMDGLHAGLNRRFGGGMERASANLSVAMSNMGIAFSELGRALGDGVGGVGLTGAFTFLADTLSQVFTILKPVAHLLGTALAGALYAVMAPLRLVTEAILGLGRAAAEMIAWAGDLLPESWTTLREGAASLSASLSDLEATMNRNITPVEAVSAAAQAQEETLAGLNDQLKEAQALLNGYTAEQIAALKQAELWDSMEMDHDGVLNFTGTEEQVAAAAALNDEINRINIAIREANQARDAQTAYDETLLRLQNELRIAGIALYDQNQANFEQMIEGMTLTDEQIASLRALYDQREELRLQQELQNESERIAKENAEELNSIINSNVSSTHDLKRQIDLLSAAMGGMSEEMVPLAQEALANLQHELAMTDPAFANIVNAAEQAGNAIADNIAAGLVNGQLSMDSFLDIAKQFVQQLIAEFIRTYIIKSLLSSIFPGGGLFGAAGGGTVPAKASGGRIPAFASGGKTAGGGPILVGERGPELFIPGSAGTIKNNHDTMNMIGGGQPVVVQQTINIETGVAQTVRAEIAQLLPTIKSDTVKAVAEARRRGGSFAQAFGG